ncbi:MAG: phage tail family protein [Bacilli bacterium]|nr:phage tail family protein [Bacilli bacterium]
MENYFYINDVDSRTVGVKCGTFPPIIFPKKRIETIIIEGRDGTLHQTDNCYDSYVWSIECYSEDIDIEKIELFLRNAKTLRLSSNPEKVYDITIKNQIDLNIIAEYWRNFIITFEIQPIVKSLTEQIVDIEETSIEIVVGGTFETKPTIELTGSGDFTISINSNNIIIGNLNEETIVIDTDLRLAVIDNVNAMNKINANFNNIKLKVGINTIAIVGEYENFKIKYKRCYLC